MSGNIPLAAAAKVLFKELRALKKEPVEGFRIVHCWFKLRDELHYFLGPFISLSLVSIRETIGRQL